MPNEISGESRKIARLISLSFFSKKEEAGLLSEISGESRKISHLISLSFFSKKDEAGSSRQRRVCRVGAGVETVAFSNNTPGFPSCVEPSIVQDIRGFKKLQMPRNHPRIMQTSLRCVRSWRANCDVQILLYDSDPLNPSPADIAKATDYIVGYACKGNESLKTEKLHMTSLILQSHEVAGDDSDVIRVARQLLNQTVGNKMISKQECMVHLGQLRLFECSETIETHSLSGYYRLSPDQSDLLHCSLNMRPGFPSMKTAHFMTITMSSRRIQAMLGSTVFLILLEHVLNLSTL